MRGGGRDSNTVYLALRNGRMIPFIGICYAVRIIPLHGNSNVYWLCLPDFTL